MITVMCRSGSSESEMRLYLLEFEDVLVEVMLQRLVGEVDAELLEAVVLVVLEAEDVQHPDGQDLKHINPVIRTTDISAGELGT